VTEYTLVKIKFSLDVENNKEGDLDKTNYKIKEEINIFLSRIEKIERVKHILLHYDEISN
jgi:hypothetical protein